LPAPPREKLEYLNSLRGMAALFVSIKHAFFVFPEVHPSDRFEIGGFSLLRSLTFTPFHLLWGGMEVVIFFYVLSGFALALPYVRGTASGYGDFLIKRFCRLYPPYMAIVFISSILLLFNLNHHEVQGAARVWLREWQNPVSGREALRLLFMAGNFQNVDKALWSLLFEMEICLFFPLLVWGLLRLDWKMNLVLAILAGWTATLWMERVRSHPTLSCWEGFYYVPLFIFGITVAKYREPITLFLKAIPAFQKAALVLAVFVLFNWRWEFWRLPILHGQDPWVDNMAVGAATAGIIAFALAWPSFQRFLSHPFLVWMGQRSYSYYLIHTVVLLAAVHFLPAVLPLAVKVLLGFLLNFPMTALFHRFLEKPSQTWGRGLVEKFRGGF
jgi:peptidoglycan/LPS O-acetylase OafA/YrhL